MATISVKKPFHLLLSVAQRLSFEPGIHDVSEEVAKHWWTGLHADVISLEGEVAAVAEEAATEVSGLAAKTDEELHQLIADATGKRAHPKTGRAKLEAMAAEAAKVVGDTAATNVEPVASDGVQGEASETGEATKTDAAQPTATGEPAAAAAGEADPTAQ